MEALHKHIQQVVALTDADFAQLKTAFEFKKIKKGHYLLQQGQLCLGDYFVLSGSLIQGWPDQKGKVYVVQFALKDWWIADWDSILRGQPSRYQIRALEDSTLLYISYTRLQDLFVQVPALERYFRVIFQQAFAAQQRRIGWLQLPALLRYREFIRAYPGLELILSQALIAAFLGITRESLSRLKAKALHVDKG